MTWQEMDSFMLASVEAKLTAHPSELQTCITDSRASAGRDEVDKVDQGQHRDDDLGVADARSAVSGDQLSHTPLAVDEAFQTP
jgi:hypothetical protein